MIALKIVVHGNVLGLFVTVSNHNLLEDSCDCLPCESESVMTIRSISDLLNHFNEHLSLRSGFIHAFHSGVSFMSLL